MNFFIAAAPFALVAVSAHAQDAAPMPEAGATVQSAPAPAPQVTFTAPAREAVLRTGLPIKLAMAEEVTTKNKAAKVGQRVRLEVAEDVMLDGVVVIPKGTPAMGELTEVRNKGMWGKSGKLIGRVLYMRVGDRQIRLSGAFDDKGIAGTAGVVGAAVLLPLAGFFITGTSARLPLGGVVNGFLDEDVPIKIAASQEPKPLVVSDAAPAAETVEQQYVEEEVTGTADITDD